VLGPLVAFFGTGYYSGFGAVIAELYPTPVRATAAGVCYNTGRIASAAAPFVVGSLAASRGFFAAFAVAGFAFFLAAVMWIWIPETRERRSRPSSTSTSTHIGLACRRRHVRRLHGRRLAGVPQGPRRHGRRSDRGRAGDAALDRRAHDDGDVGRRRLSARDRGRRVQSSIQLGIQGGLCFGISLILGGVFFAGVMRRHGFTTLIDPFEARFGKRWAAVLFLPGARGRAVLERRAAGRDRFDVRRPARNGPHVGDPSLRGS
jgi:hypothetical protein